MKSQEKVINPIKTSYSGIVGSSPTGMESDAAPTHGGYSSTIAVSRPSAGVSRDEMNLAEFPLTVLSTRTDPKLKTLEFKDLIKGKNGEVLERRWIITGADKFGLPTASDDEVLLGLLKLTVDDGVQDRKVFFTRYELLRTLKWTTEGRSYSRLQKALDRLSGVRIKASNAFFDNDTKAHSTKNFGIIDAYEINSGKDSDAKMSYFTWSETIFKSFQVGFIKKLDLDFYLDLQSAVAKRLYRYLDKHFWYKSKIQVELFTLAHEKLGVPRSYQYASSIRQLLDPAFEELAKRNFLGRYEYVGKGKNTEVILYSAQGQPKTVEAKNSHRETNNKTVSPQATVHGGVAEQGTLPLQEQIRTLLEKRGITAGSALRLVGGRSQETLVRMQSVIEHFDSLVLQKSRLISKSPVGFLYRAIERVETFVLPGEKRSTEVISEPAPIATQTSSSEHRSSGIESKTEEQIGAYLVDKKRALSQAKQTLEPSLLGSITSEVEKALQKLKEFISPSRFDEAVHHGVDDKIAKLIQFPEFEVWKNK